MRRRMNSLSNCAVRAGEKTPIFLSLRVQNFSSYKYLPSHFNSSKEQKSNSILLAIMAFFNGSRFMWIMWIYCWTSSTILKSHLNASLNFAIASLQTKKEGKRRGGWPMRRKQLFFMRKCIFLRLIALRLKKKLSIKKCFFTHLLELSTPLNHPFSFSRLNLTPRVTTMNSFLLMFLLFSLKSFTKFFLFLGIKKNLFLFGVFASVMCLMKVWKEKPSELWLQKAWCFVAITNT